MYIIKLHAGNTVCIVNVAMSKPEIEAKLLKRREAYPRNRYSIHFILDSEIEALVPEEGVKCNDIEKDLFTRLHRCAVTTLTAASNALSSSAEDMDMWIAKTLCHDMHIEP